jgi:hypothetical protein
METADAALDFQQRVRRVSPEVLPHFLALVLEERARRFTQWLFRTGSGDSVTSLTATLSSIRLSIPLHPCEPATIRAELVTSAVSLPGRFEASMVSGLPEPARRFFTFAIQPGTRPSTIVELTMSREISFGTKDEPKYQPMTARQVLAPPQGLV